jgi:hypothetical protein
MVGMILPKNRQPQLIKASRQNRPDISVDHSGRIFVIYTAENAKTTTQFFSISNDNGHSFSIPIPLSDKASEAVSFLGRLALIRLISFGLMNVIVLTGENLDTQCIPLLLTVKVVLI